MKTIPQILCLTFLTISCQNPAKDSGAVEDSLTREMDSTEKIEYAYTTDHPADNWDRGDMKNAAMVLSALKAYETGNIDECIKYFADSVRLGFDYFQTKTSRDSVKAMFSRNRNNYTSYTIKMDDFESVISKDKKDSYVSLWYKEIWTDKTGKTDSINVMDDLKIVNGKIASIDQKVQHFQPK